MAKKMGNLETSVAIWVNNCYPSPMLEEELMEGVHIRWQAQPAPDPTCLQLNMFEASDTVIDEAATTALRSRKQETGCCA
jgi:hypothetical protein